MDPENKTNQAIENISTMWLFKLLCILDNFARVIVNNYVSDYGVTQGTPEYKKIENVRQLMYSILDTYKNKNFMHAKCNHGYTEMYNFTRLLVITTTYYYSLLLKHGDKTTKSYNVLSDIVYLYSRTINIIFDTSGAGDYSCRISKLRNLIRYCEKQFNKCDNKMKNINIDDYELIKYSQPYS